MSREEFQTYWREQHGPLVASKAGGLGIRRYVQVHTLAEDHAHDLAGPRGRMEKPYDGVAELWWHSRDGLAEAISSPEGQEASGTLFEDEARFIDLARSPLWLGYEYPQVNPSPENIVAKPNNSVVKFYYPLRHPKDQTFDEVQLYWRTTHGPLIRSVAEAGHIKRYVQVHRFEDEIETALREVRGCEVETYTGHAELWFDRGDLLGPLMPERAHGGELAIADERRFIDFERSSMWLAKEQVIIDRDPRVP
jgi:uncharacterized protein (TIGR02118 family)